jgi:hypothetical protein
VGDTYPNLGFNPVPGMPESVESLGGQVTSAVDSMGEAGRLMARLRNANDSVWQGDAANAFREHFNTKLADELDHAHQSLGKAVAVIRGWHTDLVNFKDVAAKLEAEAAAARREQQQAEAALRQAKSNPDLGLAGRIFDDPAALQQAQAKLNAAESALRETGARAEGAADKLDDVLRRAKELQAHHEDVARRAAQALKDATHKLAPHEPGLLSRMAHAFTSALSAVGDWVKAHIKDIHAVLSTVSAIAGLVALVTPPPVDAIALGVSVVAGAGALATDLADPQFRHGIGELIHGHFNKESIGALTTGAADAASLIPGAGVGVKAIKGGEAVAEGATGAARIADLASAAAHQPGWAVKQLGKLPGAAALGDAATFADKLLSNGIPQDIRSIDRLDRLNLFWKAKGVASNLYHDVQEAVS